MHVRLLLFILGIVVVWDQCQGGVFFSNNPIIMRQ